MEALTQKEARTAIKAFEQKIVKKVVERTAQLIVYENDAILKIQGTCGAKQKEHKRGKVNGLSRAAQKRMKMVARNVQQHMVAELGLSGTGFCRRSNGSASVLEHSSLVFPCYDDATGGHKDPGSRLAPATLRLCGAGNAG